jgi:hypothetical protein
MRRKLLIMLLFLFSLASYGQTWNGGGDGHSWNDASNWNNNQVPQDGDNVLIKGGTLTIDGTATNNPAQVKIGVASGQTSATITLDLDISIGNGTYTEHAIIVNSDCSLILGTSGNNRTFTLNTPSNKNGVNIFSSQSNANITIASSTSLNISNGQHSMNIACASCTGNNNGTISISNSGTDGINMPAGTFTNNSGGSLSITGAGQDGIDVSSSFNNSGTVTISNSSTNGINHKSGATFSNSGTLNISGGTNGIYVQGGTFTNTNSGTMTINGSSDGIDNLSTFDNNGSLTITSTTAKGINNKSGGVFNNYSSVSITNGTDGIISVGTYNNSSSSTLNITSSSSDGVENSGTFSNSGSITIQDANTNGINHKAGTFTNNSTISITNPGATTTDGIKSSSTFNNESGATITISKPSDDCIEVINNSTFTNDGSVEVTIEDGAGTNNNGIAVGTDADDGIFINNSNNSLTAHGGVSTVGRAIYVYEKGTLTNNGTITVDGGNDGARIYSKGTMTNKKGATINLTDGRINNNTGSTFTNNGLLKSTRTGSGIYNPGGAATNNAFFWWDSGANTSFSVGAGTNTDNGIALDANKSASLSTNDDGDGNDCTADIAEVDYLWNDGNNDYQASSTGQVTFSSTSSSIDLTTSEYGTEVSITVNDVCETLPLNLTDFRGVFKENFILLNWSLVSRHSTEIVVEHSVDGNRFTELSNAFVSNDYYYSGTYEFIDKNPVPGMNYYRLKIIDEDGLKTYSWIISIKTEFNKDKNLLVIYPTFIKTGEQLNCYFNGEIPNESNILEIYNSNGKKIVSKVLYQNNSAIIFSENLNKGIYYLKYVNKDRLEVQKFFVTE